MTDTSVYNVSSNNMAQNSDILAPILARAKKGEQSAFGEIYNLYFKKIYTFIYFRVGNKENAEDLAEEVFLKAFEKLSFIKDNATFLGWLYQIARNQVIDHYREKKVTVTLDEVENTLVYESNVIDVINLEQQQKVFLKYLKEISPEQQIVIKLKFFEDLDNAEIAEMMNKTEGAIRVIQHRAITRLQELIQGNK